MELKQLCEKTKEIFQIYDISDLSEKLLKTCLENHQEYMEQFVDAVEDLSVDWLQKIFQYYEADRKEKMQDYTPLSLARFVGRLTETDHENNVYDLCAGSGALTIQKWNLNHDLSFVCYEYDKKVIPFLLFNLAVRNINAIVINGDALQEEVFTRYAVKSGDRFGTVHELKENVYYNIPDSCISNPPYNMKWKHPPFAQIQPRFFDCGIPPESNANYAFILSALDKINEKAAFILPNCVLETNNKQEKEIKKYLVEKNLIEAVISCPDKMFEATSIPVCIIVFNKNKETTHITFVDMRQTFETEVREQNGQYGGKSHEKRTYKKEVKVFTDAQMEKAIKVINGQNAEPGFSKTVSIKTVSENDYGLIPSSYIDLQEQEINHREYGEIIDDLNRVIKEKNRLKLTMNESMAKSLGMYDVFQEFKQSEELNKNMNGMLEFTGKKIEKEKFISLSKNAGELKFENGSKNDISTILLSILQMWRQHIMYLNNEENRYLVELRDALLPDMMSGKIKLDCGSTVERK